MVRHQGTTIRLATFQLANSLFNDFGQKLEICNVLRLDEISISRVLKRSAESAPSDELCLLCLGYSFVVLQTLANNLLSDLEMTIGPQKHLDYFVT